MRAAFEQPQNGSGFLRMAAEPLRILEHNLAPFEQVFLSLLSEEMRRRSLYLQAFTDRGAVLPTEVGKYVPAHNPEVLSLFKEVGITGRPVVDLGCGPGTVLVVAATQGASDLIGVDGSPRILEDANALLRRNFLVAMEHNYRLLAISLGLSDLENLLAVGTSAEYAAVISERYAPQSKIVSGNFVEPSFNLDTVGDTVTPGGRKVYFYYVNSADLGERPELAEGFLKKFSNLPPGSTVILYSLEHSPNGRFREFSPQMLTRILPAPSKIFAHPQREIERDIRFLSAVFEL